MVNFLPIASPKITTSKKLVSQHLQPKFFQWVHHIYLLALCYSKYVYHVILCYLISEFKCLCYWLSWEKLVKSSHELDAQFTFIAFNKHEPLWLKLWSCGLDNSFGWELAHMCCHMASFQHCTYLYLVDVMNFCLWIPIMGEMNADT